MELLETSQSKHKRSKPFQKKQKYVFSYKSERKHVKKHKFRAMKAQINIQQFRAACRGEQIADVQKRYLLNGNKKSVSLLSGEVWFVTV